MDTERAMLIGENIHEWWIPEDVVVLTRRRGPLTGGQRAMETPWGQSPGFPVTAAAGGRSSSKNIRLFKVKVSSAKLLAMVEMVE